MAKLTQKEFMEKVKVVLGDRTDDDAISFLEDCKDTISSEGDDWKQKYDDVVKEKEELDKTWRQKYTDRFFAPDDSHIDDDKTTHEKNKKTNPANVDKDDIGDEEKAKLEQAEKVRIDDLFKDPAENK